MIVFLIDTVIFPAITSTLAALSLMLVIITVLVVIVVCANRKKSVNLQANPIDSNASALYDVIDSDKTDTHIYEDVELTRTHIYEAISDSIAVCEAREPQELDDSKGRDTYEGVPDVDIARVVDDSKGNDTYERVPDVDIA